MALSALTSEQQRAVGDLVARGRIAAVPADLAKALIFMRQAQDVIADLPNLTKPQNRYNLAYDACHDIGEAVLAAYGYRTLSGPGQHEKPSGASCERSSTDRRAIVTPVALTSCVDRGTSSATTPARSAKPRPSSPRERRSACSPRRSRGAFPRIDSAVAGRAFRRSARTSFTWPICG